MGVIQRIVKPKNQRSKRALEAREPKAIENAKSAIFIRGPKSSDMVMKAMRDLHALKRPNVAPEFYGKSKQRLSNNYGKLEKLNQLLIHIVAYKGD